MIKSQEKLFQISAIFDKYDNKMPPSLFSGKAGIVLFYSYIYKFSKDEKYLSKVNQIIDEIFFSIEQNEITTSIDHGITGIGWLLQHLIRIGVLEDVYDDILNDIDELLFESFSKDVSLFRYDYLTGLIGKGHYYLERYEFDKCHFNGVEKVLNEILKLKDLDSPIWQDYYAIQKSNVNQKIYNLGLAHGNPSILYFLSKVYSFKKDNVLLKIIKKNAYWLINQEVKKPEGEYLPNYLIDNLPFPSSYKGLNLAWCYGDLGMLIALLQCGIIIDDEYIIEHCVKRALYISEKIPENMPHDAGLCHGLAGISQIFNRFYQYTIDIRFKNAAEFLIINMLQFCQFDDGLAGFKTQKKDIEWQNDFSFLTGISGIGLALISSIDNKLSDWDRLLLLN